MPKPRAKTKYVPTPNAAATPATTSTTGSGVGHDGGGSHGVPSTRGSAARAATQDTAAPARPTSSPSRQIARYAVRDARRSVAAPTPASRSPASSAERRSPEDRNN